MSRWKINSLLEGTGQQGHEETGKRGDDEVKRVSWDEEEVRRNCQRR